MASHKKLVLINVLYLKGQSQKKLYLSILVKIKISLEDKLPLPKEAFLPEE
jgi:hypothetical protein